MARSYYSEADCPFVGNLTILKMSNDEALDRVETYRKQHALPGTLEALTQMRDFYRDLDKLEREAFDVAFAGFRRLFYGDG